MTGARFVRLLGAVCATTLMVAGTASAQDAREPPEGLAGRFSLHINGLFQSRSEQFQGTTEFVLYDEDGRFTSDHVVGGDGVIDGGGRIQMWRQLSVGATYTQMNGSEGVTLAGSVPHPFQFDVFRPVGPEPFASKYRERSTHVELAWRFPFPDVPEADITIFGGPSFFNVSRDIPGEIIVTETAPPFSTADIRIETARESKNGFGGHVGVDATFMLTPQFGLGLVVRFVGGSADISAGTDTVSVNTGGVQGGGGIRFRF